ncbi:sigma-54-dependent transcriptional regulator [Megalodesulfovibrio gigas]|uniref:Putative Fis family two component sigma-54 specific transcriptional regulator n=1 Tax=Megalodesulfovibrio gigas (strain ATCC 19364 / DSM 1382 / NCIMB 9332 / VKM B-1759) TaxID=1121448 RepID=T2GBP6_MEGG1|nr:sigma-54 dependent transcriptional regulator [Megalodesulfovibrio gigas]AGW13718.1 putative Fis family two component sigma-54 specific transcriptional regulator [Megalodesulfovibrio gigas DSM 1382 = ATCC 19364]
MKRLCIIDDEPGHRLMVRAIMEDAGWDVVEAGSGEDGLRLLREELHAAEPGQRSGVVLLDMRMPGMDGRQTLHALQRLRPELPVVMLTAYGSVDVAVEAMKRGAFDFLTKPADNEELLATLEKAHEYGRLLAESAALARGSTDALAADLEPCRTLVGESPAMREVKELIARAGPSEATILILGESGTGKELIAEALHAASRRAAMPMIKINCAALPEQLLESELFGYKKGAFTGAVKDKPGRFVLADGGTLFLDEIGELPMAVQAKLLRALQERVIEPLGGVKPVPVDVRVLAATNKDLAQAIAEGTFREDLYFRLNILEITAPPLRERLEDVPLLASHLLDKLARKNRRAAPAVSGLFLDALRPYPWPGNVRELENVLERALILASTDMLQPAQLPPRVLEARSPAVSGAGAHMAAVISPALLEEAEREAIVKALDAHRGHRERTAQALGISRRTLQYKISRYGLAKRRDAADNDSLQ